MPEKSGPTSESRDPIKSEMDETIKKLRDSLEAEVRRLRTSQGFFRDFVSHLLVAILVGVATYAWATLNAKEKVEEAPTIYVQELDKLINTAAKEGEDNAITNAKAIVAARNSLAGSLSAIGSQLDSQIDVLAGQIGLSALVAVTAQGNQKIESKNAPDKHEVYTQILVVQKIWPAKRRQIEIEIRKLLAELGLYGGSKQQSSIE